MSGATVHGGLRVRQQEDSCRSWWRTWTDIATNRAAVACATHPANESRRHIHMGAARGAHGAEVALKPDANVRLIRLTSLFQSITTSARSPS